MNQISPGTMIVGIFAVLFGAVGAYALREHLREPVAAPAPEEPRPVAVPMASTDLEAGRPLRLTDIAIVRVPRDKFKDYGVEGQYIQSTNFISGRILRQPLKKGETFKTEMFYPEGMEPSVAERLQPGFRALTVPITNASMMSGLVVPSSFVDILFRTHGEDNLPATTVTLLEHVEVLAIGTNQVPGLKGGSASSSRDGNVTLAVSPEQANILKIVEDRGDMALAMRNPNDLDFVSQVSPQTLESLLGIQGSGTFTAEIYRGGSVERKSFRRPRSAPSPGISFPVRANTRPSVDTRLDDRESEDETQTSKQAAPPRPDAADAGEASTNDVGATRRENDTRSVAATP